MILISFYLNDDSAILTAEPEFELIDPFLLRIPPAIKPGMGISSEVGDVGRDELSNLTRSTSTRSRLRPEFVERLRC